MSWLHKIEKRLAPFAIPHPTLWLVFGQTFVLLTGLLGLVAPNRLTLVPSLVMEGEIWRVATFVFMPFDWSWLFSAFTLYLLYLFGTALEHQWGVFRFNLFLLTGYLLTIGSAFIFPDETVRNIFVNASIFMAFAHLNPDYILNLFFILPVRVRILAAAGWALYGLMFVLGTPATRVTILAASGNFLLFFGKSMIQDIRSGRRRLQHQGRMAAARREAAATPRHTCVVCGKNSDTHPDLDFRYCSKCAGDQCYCPDHLRDHEHITEENLHASS